MEGDGLQGIILRGIGGFYYALDESGAVNQLRAQAKIRRERLKPLVGDRIEFEPGQGEEDGWVKRILPRTTELVRPPVANIDLIVIVAAVAAPDPDLLLVDRLMVNARRAGIGVRLVVNKCDLDAEAARRLTEQYRGAEVEPLCVSTRTGEGVDTLRKSLKGRVHALAGQSGAGKSSLINALYGLKLETGSLSRRIERGKNTTRHSELIPVPGGGMVLDTPGFSLLETGLFEPLELKAYYPEFTSREGRCFFSPCAHATEPRCVVREAVAAGEISPERHARYCELLEEARLKWRNRYD